MLTKISRVFVMGTTALLCSLNAASANTVTIQGTVSEVGNCIPFGCPGFFDPYMGFVYQNIPSFNLQVGDILAFDTGRPNDTPLTFDIALATATSNGAAVENGAGYTTVVANGLPATPLGDSIVGNFDLAYTVTSSFAFSGGGLLIRFQPTGAALGDETFDQNLVYSHGSDPSGYFVNRFYFDADGVGPYPSSDASYVGHFQVVTSNSTPVPDPGSSASLLLMGLGSVLAVRRR